MANTLDDLLRKTAAGEPLPVSLVVGDLVVAEPRARQLAEALAEARGCTVEEHRRPAGLGRILADLRTYSLFDTAKVVLVVDAAILADEKSAAELVDQAAAALPLPSGETGAALIELPGRREAASRVLQALRVFGLDPHRTNAEDAIAALPEWALKGGNAYRKGHSRGRGKKQVRTLAEGLARLLEAAREAGLQGFADGDQAELGELAAGRLPEGHALVLAEASAASEHPIVARLEAAGAVARVGEVGVGRGGFEGLAFLVDQLCAECGVSIARDAVEELTRRTLRKTGSWGQERVDGQSSSRFAGEFRKLASLAGAGRITRAMVVESVEDRGEQDVWQILDAIGAGRGEEAIERLRRHLAGADNADGARLSFFTLLARFCRQLVAVSAAVDLLGIPAGETYYPRFKQKWAPRLLGDIPLTTTNPLRGTHPFQLHRAYLAASKIPARQLAGVPSWVLETELRLKGDVTQADAALFALIGRLVGLRRG